MTHEDRLPFPKCGICRSEFVVDFDEFATFHRVSSDCKLRPVGGRIGFCTGCGAVQKPVDDFFNDEVRRIYENYQIYHQAGGDEQPIFDHNSGQTIARSVQLIEKIRKHTPMKSRGRMLDVGCGNGATLRAFSQAFPAWNKTGTEFSHKNADLIGRIPNTSPLHVGEVEELNGQFDFISMIHVLEHIINPLDFLKSLRKKLSPNGNLFIEVPHHRDNPFDLLIADHRMHFSQTSLQRLLYEAGFSSVVVTDQWVPGELSCIATLRQRRLTAESMIQETATEVCDRIQRTLAWLRDAAAQLDELCRTDACGLFGTSIAGTWLAAEGNCDVAYFVDEDSSRWEHYHLGRRILDPSTLNDGSTVFVGLAPLKAQNIAHRLARAGISFVVPRQLDLSTGIK